MRGEMVRIDPLADGDAVEVKPVAPWCPECGEWLLDVIPGLLGCDGGHRWGLTWTSSEETQ